MENVANLGIDIAPVIWTKIHILFELYKFFPQIFKKKKQNPNNSIQGSCLGPHMRFSYSSLQKCDHTSHFAGVSDPDTFEEYWLVTL